MAKNKEKEEEAPLTDVQIKVDNERRFKLFNDEVGKLCEKYEVAIVPILDGYPQMLKPVIKIVSTKKYEVAENQSAQK